MEIKKMRTKQLTLDGRNAEICPYIDICESNVLEFTFRTLCQGNFRNCPVFSQGLQKWKEEWKKPREWIKLAEV